MLLETAAGRKAELVEAGTYEDLITLLGLDDDERMISQWLFSGDGASTKGRAVGTLKRHLSGNDAYGWDDGQRFVVYQIKLGPEWQVGRWHIAWARR